MYKYWTLVFSFFIYSSCFAEVLQVPAYNPPGVLNFVRPYLPENPVILECGGYDGEDTALMANYWTNSTIYTFEPVPNLFAKMQERTANYSNVHRFQLALADYTGKMTFHLAFFPWGECSGSSSLLPPKDHVKFDWSQFNQNIEVDAMTLDDWASQEGIDHIDFMWLDMQGYELNTIKNSKIAKAAKLIYMEVEFVEAYEGQYLYGDIKEWMEQNGFRLLGLDFLDYEQAVLTKDIQPHNGLPWMGNAVFINKDYNINVE